MPKKAAAPAVEEVIHETEKLSLAAKAKAKAKADPKANLNTADTDKPAKKSSKKSAIVKDSSDEAEDAVPAKAEKPKTKRKPSEYNLFIGEQIKKIGEDHKELPVTERMKMAQKLWKERKESLAAAKA